MTATVSGLLRNRVNDSPDSVAVTDDDRITTYRELDGRASQVANALARDGVDEGDRVAFVSRNCTEFFELLYGTARRKAIFVPLNFRLTGHEIIGILNDAQPKVLIVSHEYIEHLDEFRAQVPSLRTLAVISTESEMSYDVWRDSQSAEAPEPNIDADDVVLLAYTSGTTGKPKGALLTSKNYHAALSAAERPMGLSADSIHVFALPLFHIGGLVFATGLSAHAGAATLLLRDGRPEKILDVVDRHHATHLCVVPTLLTAMLDTLEKPEYADIDLSSLNTIFYGASPMPESLLRRAIERFGSIRFATGYGATETTGAMIIKSPEDHDLSTEGVAARLRGVGRPSLDSEVRVVDPENFRDCGPGKVGEILLRGPQIMRGYWQLPEATAEVLLPTGWYRTGDVGYLDKDAYLFLTDRIKDMYISGGENVYSPEVEHLIMQLPGVREVAIIGIPHERLGETGKAFVATESGVDLTKEDVIAFCRSRLAAYKCPTRVAFVAELPRNAAGKVVKPVLRKQQLEQSAGIEV